MSVIEMTPAAYHSGELLNRPALSKSIIQTLLTKSPLHAWTEHPKLNPNYQREDSGIFDLGTVAHALFLENDETGVVVLDFPNYTTKAAKEARDYARSLGKIPMLQKHWDDAKAVVDGIREGVSAVKADPPLFVGGKPEQSVVWDDHGALCKMRADYLHDNYEVVEDLKTTARSGAPEQFSRSLFSMGYDVQAAFYQRGVRAVSGRDCVFRLVVVEIQPPYAVSVFQLSPAALALANQKIDFALINWRTCLANDRWPGYPKHIMHVEPPTWEETRMYEREDRDEGEAA